MAIDVSQMDHRLRLAAANHKIPIASCAEVLKNKIPVALVLVYGNVVFLEYDPTGKLTTKFLAYLATPLSQDPTSLDITTFYVSDRFEDTCLYMALHPTSVPKPNNLYNPSLSQPFTETISTDWHVKYDERSAQLRKYGRHFNSCQTGMACQCGFAEIEKELK